MKPEVGQRWRLECGCAVELGGEESTRAGFSGLMLAREVACSRAITHFGWLDSPAWFAGAEYLGPAPAPSSTVGAPAMAGPPDGRYRRCISEGCPVYAHPWRASGFCWPHYAVATGIDIDSHASRLRPDWVPPTVVPPTREPPTVRDSRMVAPPHQRMMDAIKEQARQEFELATIARVRAHQLAEGGDSAVAKAPGRTPPTLWVSSVDPDHWIPDAEPHSSRYRR